MPDCFISYSNTDQEFAKSVHSELEKHTITAFMASVSLQPGQDWSKEIMENLRNSKWVILLASRAACSSEFVNQEIGVALHNAKNLIPIVWDMAPSKLPGWAKDVQAIDIRQLKQTMGRIAKGTCRFYSPAYQAGQKPRAIDHCRNNNPGSFYF